MNPIVTSEEKTRQAISHLTGISRKADARSIHSKAPILDVLPRLVRKRPEPAPPGSFKRPYQANEAGARDHNTYSKRSYKTGDGDTVYALRPGALDFKAIPSRTGFDA